MNHIEQGQIQNSILYPQKILFNHGLQFQTIVLFFGFYPGILNLKDKERDVYHNY